MANLNFNFHLLNSNSYKQHCNQIEKSTQRLDSVRIGSRTRPGIGNLYNFSFIVKSAVPMDVCNCRTVIFAYHGSRQLPNHLKTVSLFKLCVRLFVRIQDLILDHKQKVLLRIQWMWNLVWDPEMGPTHSWAFYTFLFGIAVVYAWGICMHSQISSSQDSVRSKNVTYSAVRKR